MPSPWPELLALVGIVAWVAPAVAQHGREIGVQVTATASDPALAVAGLYGALRTSARTRVSAALGAGVAAGELAGRGELLGHFLLNPGQPRRSLRLGSRGWAWRRIQGRGGISVALHQGPVSKTPRKTFPRRFSSARRADYAAPDSTISTRRTGWQYRSPNTRSCDSSCSLRFS